MFPLKDIKVLELAEEIAGPHCGMQLSDSGADVIKVEPLIGDWSRHLGTRVKGESALFMALNRGKRSIAVNQEDPKGRGIILKLAREADVIIESYGPGKADELGVGYDLVAKLNPGVVYCSISPFGTKGPYSKLPASELEIQGMAGFQWFLGEMGEPPVRLGPDQAGVDTGIWSFIGIISALYSRNKTGVGQNIQSSMLLNMIAMMVYVITAHFNPDSPGGFHFSGPFDHAETGYRTKDRAILFGMPLIPGKQELAWESFCRQVGLGDLLEDPYFKEKGMRMVGIGRDAQEFKPVIEPALENKTSEEIRKIVEGLGGYFAMFKTYEDVFSEPQIKAVKMVEEIDHPAAGKIKVTGIPWKLLDTPAQIKSAPPLLGQHTDEILRDIGYSNKDIANLRESKIIN